MSEQTKHSTRRGFLKTLGAAVAVPYVLTSTALGGEGRAPASDRITLGWIGMGSRGNGVMGSFMRFGDVRVVAVCDVVKRKRDAAKAQVDKKYGNKDCAAYNDFRDIIVRGDIDVACVTTPDHWHAIPAIEACRHGKDVFCEKPLSLTIREGRAMVEAARRYGRVVSGGSQRVLGDYGGLARYVRSGAIGEIREVYVGVGGPSRPCNLPAQPVPPGVDWDMWLGPAPWVPFNKGRLNFRPWQDYSGGQMTDWGGHKFGAAIFALGLDETGPVEIIPPDGREHKLLTYRYQNGLVMYHSPRGHDVTYKSTLGEASRGKMGRLARHVTMRGYQGRGGLTGDFLHCVRTRERPFRDVEYGHRAASICHLGNIAYWLGRPLKWDPVKEVFIGDDEANRWLDRPKRGPWHI